MSRLGYGRTTLVAVLVMAALFLAPTGFAFAASTPVAGQAPGFEAQVQIPIPNFDFNPTKWVQDAFGALLQSFSDGIHAGMDALWDANFITQTPPSLTYRNDDIRGLHDMMRGAANAALAAVATVGALNWLRY